MCGNVMHLSQFVKLEINSIFNFVAYLVFIAPKAVNICFYCSAVAALLSVWLVLDTIVCINGMQNTKIIQMGREREQRAAYGDWCGNRSCRSALNIIMNFIMCFMFKLFRNDILCRMNIGKLIVMFDAFGFLFLVRR